MQERIVENGIQYVVKNGEKYLEAVQRIKNGRIAKNLLVAAGDSSNDKKLEEGLKTLSKQMNADKAIALANEALGFANIAVGACNLAVTAAEFAYMKKRFDDISKALSIMSADLNQLKAKQDVDILREFQDAESDYLEMLDYDKRHEEYPKEKLYSLVTKFYATISSLQKYFISNACGQNKELLNCIYMMLPMYISVLVRYDTVYYFKYSNTIEDGSSKWDNQHDNWVSILDLMRSPEFINCLNEYCFLEEKLTNRDTLKALHSSNIVVEAAKQGVEDNQTVLTSMHDQSQNEQLQKEINNEAVADIKQQAATLDPEIAELICQRIDKGTVQTQARS
jgi:hypothetical protein